MSIPYVTKCVKDAQTAAWACYNKGEDKGETL